ncbi:MAG: protein translocase subunit SecF [Ignavibacteriae bacterium]|nr:protein translocase subunit SecF [Ignavibacteriota bacterium]
MRFFEKTNIDFLKPRRTMYVLSLLIIAAGIVSLFVRGIDFGIDFRGGTEVLLQFEQPVEISEIRTALGSIGMSQSEIKTFGSDQNILIRTTEKGVDTEVGDRIKNAIQTNLSDTKFTVQRQYGISPKIGDEMRTKALYAIIAGLVAILGYIAIRFKFIYGVGAVAALFHDVLVTLSVMSILDGVFAWLNMEITLEVVAAFLTLVGVSVNDTVVIFDRIRENLKIYRTLSLGEVINRSLNDTLNRTIVTNGTIFSVLLVLLLGGGEVTRGFSFALVVGTIAGTYSTIYIASAIVLDWTLRQKTTK